VDRGRKDHWAMYPAPAKIPVVYEPDPSQPDPRALKAGKKPTARQVLATITERSLLQFMDTREEARILREQADRFRGLAQRRVMPVADLTVPAEPATEFGMQNPTTFFRSVKGPVFRDPEDRPPGLRLPEARFRQMR